MADIWERSDDPQANFSLLTAANEVWCKVMFLHMCVILFTGGCLHPRGEVGQIPPSDITGYGKRADGMHPTGIHSCFYENLGK